MDTYKVTLRVNHRCIGSGNEATAEGPASQEGHSELPKGEREIMLAFSLIWFRAEKMVRM